MRVDAAACRRGSRRHAHGPCVRGRCAGREPTRARVLALGLGLSLAALVAAPEVVHADDGEARRARATASRIELEWPLLGSGPVATYVRKLGATLGATAGATPYPWRFVVVRDRSANAFAIGGGRIYVNEGVILACENEAEVAAILAHEMGHQLAGHFRDGARAASASGGASARIELGAVTQEIDVEKEIEADRRALEILSAAGYDPHASLTLALREDATGRVALHLRDPRRIDSLRAALAGAPPGGRLDSAAFRTLQEKQRAERG